MTLAPVPARVLAALFFPPVACAQESPQLHWDPGAEDCAEHRATTQSQALDLTTIVIRQSPCVDYEAPLMYLLIGNERALLIDSGASDAPEVTGELTRIVGGYLARPDGSRLPLVVAHTHGHQDHRSGDAALAALPDTRIVPHDSAGLRAFFGFDTWPDDEVRFDLGGREVVLRPAPGHHPDHVVFVDLRTRLLFSGDFYLPGRLLVDDIDAYRDSANKMVEFVQTWGVQTALGAHVEMNTAGELYGGGDTFHPHERQVALPFSAREAAALERALAEFNGFYNRHADYVITNPVRNLIALAMGSIVALVLLGWGARRFRRAR